MRYILDSNIALKWVLDEPDSPKALQLREEFKMGLHELLAPDVFELEVAHALTRAERSGRIDVGDASILWSDVMTTPPQLIMSGLLAPQAIAISSATRHGFYDCLYAHLAEQEGCPLITADEKIAKNLPNYPIIALDQL